jgi:hypothetical protein
MFRNNYVRGVVARLSSPYIGALGIFIGTLLSVIGIVLTIQSIKERRPVYIKRSVNIFQNIERSQLEIFYKKSKVSNLTITNIVFWNDGRQTINASDIAIAEPLRIASNDQVRILEATILFTSNPANRIRLNPQPSIPSEFVGVSFEYLDQNEGAIIQVIHDGRSSGAIELVGIVKGFGTPALIERGLGRIDVLGGKIRLTVVGYVILSVSVVVVFVLSFRLYTRHQPPISRLRFQVLLAAYLLMIPLSYWAFFYDYIPARLSKEFARAMENISSES